MKILCVIPARGGSKGVKNKNIKLLKGKPVLAYSIEDALAAKTVDLTVVSTEDPMIAEVATNLGVKVINRPAEFAQDTSPIYFALRHAVECVASEEGWTPDITVWLQANVPLRENDLVDQVVQKLINNFNKADTVSTVHKTHRYPEWMKIQVNGLLEFREKAEKLQYTRQVLDDIYLHDGSVAAIKTSVLMDDSLEKKDVHFYMGRIMPFIHEFPYTIEIDHEEDFILLEYILDKVINIK
jgi:N-acylneuraminate cytidylyltransferase/CMP-N,N'-diacetyllegionaminic acid synthase